MAFLCVRVLLLLVRRTRRLRVVLDGSEDMTEKTILHLCTYLRIPAVSPPCPHRAASTNPWPEAASNKVEYFRVAFDARLRWVDGDASKAPRQRGRGGFGGEFARRPRPAAPREAAPAAGAGSAAVEESGRTASVGSAVGGSVGGSVGGGVGVGRVLASTAAGEADGRGGAKGNEGLPEKAGPATVFCDAEIKVQVLLPPPYNTLLPWRLVRALLGKLLSTIVAYVLPRFLEVRVCVVWTRGRGGRGICSKGALVGAA